MKLQMKKRRLLSAAAVCLILLGGGSAMAGTSTWVGGGADGNWNTSGNWDVLPQEGDALVFGGTLNLASNNNLLSTAGGIQFASGAGAFTLDGSGLVLSGHYVNQSGIQQVCSIPLTITGSAQIQGGTNRFLDDVYLDGGTLAFPSGTCYLIGDGDNSVEIVNDAIVNISGATVIQETQRAWIQTSAINITAGSLSIAHALIAQDVNATAQFNVSGGTLIAGPSGSSNWRFGNNGMAIITVSDSGHVAWDARVDKGLSEAGSGKIIMNGGTFTELNSPFNLRSQSPKPNAVENEVILNDGIFTVGGFDQTNAGKNSRLIYNGGILKAKANSSAFLKSGIESVVSSIVSTGGLIFDTQAYDVTYNDVLEHDSALGSSPDGGIVKKGSGTLRLTANNTYTGNTVIEAGTLSISYPYMEDDSSVYRLGAGAVLDLNYSGQGAVAALVVGGAEQAAGSWGAIGSGAQHEAAFITGTGILLVGGAFNPNPADGATVSSTLSQLCWTNPEPNSLGQSITCDVYFGTEPNQPEMTLYPNVTSCWSIPVSLQVNTTYYWIVDCHDSSPGVVDPIPGQMWRFDTYNAPPTVSAGLDQYIWLNNTGNPAAATLDLDGTVTDDGLPVGSTLTYEWTQESGLMTVAGLPAATVDVTDLSLTALGVYEFKLTASDTIDTASDTVLVTVSEDGCKAAQAKPGFVAIPEDLNNDCFVNIGDLTEIATAWLTCNSLDPACN